MKKLLLLPLVFFFLGCATYPCPKQDIVVIADTPYGRTSFTIDKGGLNESEHNRTWLTLEELKERMKIKEFKLVPLKGEGET